MPTPSKLRTASTVMAWLSLAGAVLLAAAVPLTFLVPNPSLSFGAHGKLAFMDDAVTAAIPLANRALAMMVAAVPTALAVWALVTLFRLFRFYAAGKVFEVAPLKCLNRVTSLSFWFVLTKIVAESVKNYILQSAAGHGSISLSISTSEFGMLFLAGVALVITRVMAEAKRLADENATFI